MPLIKPIKSNDELLYEEFIIGAGSVGVWVTSDLHHIYASHYGDTDSFWSGDNNSICSINNNVINGMTVANGGESFDSAVDKSNLSTNHWFLLNSASLYHNLSGVIIYERKRDDVTYTDDYKYYAIMDTDMLCWQILKSKAREEVVGTTTGIASSKYGIVKIVEINETVATNDDGTLSDELIGAELSAWTGYWKKDGKTLYYHNAWKA